MSPSSSSLPSIAIIGSFRRHYNEVLAALQVFTGQGLRVTSPKGAPIVDPGVPFVRFTSDPDLPNHVIQTITLHRILCADLTYVVAPCGYIGRTTCYEIGRVIQAHRPIYFSECPHDIPFVVPASHVCPPDALVDLLLHGTAWPHWPFEQGTDDYSQLERSLLNGEFVPE